LISRMLKFYTDLKYTSLYIFGISINTQNSRALHDIALVLIRNFAQSQCFVTDITKFKSVAEVSGVLHGASQDLWNSIKLVDTLTNTLTWYH